MTEVHKVRAALVIPAVMMVSALLAAVVGYWWPLVGLSLLTGGLFALGEIQGGIVARRRGFYTSSMTARSANHV